LKIRMEFRNCFPCVRVLPRPEGTKISAVKQSYSQAMWNRWDLFSVQRKALAVQKQLALAVVCHAA